MDRDKTSGQSEQDDGGDEQTVVATHEQINASGMVEDQNCLEDIQYLLEVRVNVRDQASVKAFQSEFIESSNCTFLIFRVGNLTGCRKLRHRGVNIVGPLSAV